MGILMPYSYGYSYGLLLREWKCHLTKANTKDEYNNKKYGIRELKVIQSMHPTVDMATLKKIVQHAKRTPKRVNWEIIRQRMIQ